MSKGRNGRRAAVLIAGGETRWNEEMAKWLDARDFDLVTAATAEQALELFSDRRPVLVFVNLPLPGGGAAALAREVFKLEPSVQLVMAGTDAEVTSAADAFDLGAYEHLEQTTTEAFLG